MNLIRIMVYPIWQFFHYWYVIHERIGDVLFEIRARFCNFVNKNKCPF